MEWIDYKSAGVDLDKAELLKSRIKEIANKTLKDFVIHGVGPFASVIKALGGYVVATCDGVGTKIVLAKEFGKIDILGYDLVAMNVNDVIAMHGKPLFFLDYIGVPNLETVEVEKLVESIANACIEAECSLVGGETAQMPGFYKDGKFELVGFCVGIVKKTSLPKVEKVSKGDLVLAFPSNGVHSNGYSLIRKSIEEKKIRPEDKIGEHRVVDILLRPTRIYVKHFFEIVKEFGYPKVSANITGGGIPGNLSRVIPPGYVAVIEKEALDDLSRRYAGNVFSYISEFVPEQEMYRVFNMGAGFVMIYPRKKALSVLQKFGGQVFKIGYIDGAKNETKQKVIIS